MRILLLSFLLTGLALPAAATPDWEISAPVPIAQRDLQSYPDLFFLFGQTWTTAPAASTLPLPANDHEEAQLVFARTRLLVEAPTDYPITLRAPSGLVAFLNLQPLAIATDGDLSSLTLHLEPGVNELFLTLPLASASGELAVTGLEDLHGPPAAPVNVTRLWALDGFNVPESALYDPQRDVIYVSNFAQFDGTPSGFLSRVSLDGQMLDRTWVPALRNPTGLCLGPDQRLYVVTRDAVCVIDPDTAQIIARLPLPSGGFYNDLIFDPTGRLYVTNTFATPETPDVLRWVDDHFEGLATSPELDRSNGLHWHDDQLIVGSTGNGRLARVDPDSGAVLGFTLLGGGFLDGIRNGPDGSLLVSHWRGPLYHLDAQGHPTVWLESPGPGLSNADFDYVPDRHLLIIPTFYANQLVAFRVDD